MTDGWRCPVCGRGNAPTTATCSCMDTRMTPFTTSPGAGWWCQQCRQYLPYNTMHVCSGTTALTGM